MKIKHRLKHLTVKMELFVLSEWSTFVISTLGSLLYTIGVIGFTLPYRFPDAGVMGIAVILKYTIGLAPSISSLIANVILLAWGGRELSKRFVAWTIYNVLLISFLLEALNFVQFPVVNDMFLVAIAGGIIKGVGGGLIFRTGVSGGGMDIVIAVLRKRYGIEVGRYSFYINMVILGVSMGIVGLEKMLYGFVASYVSGQTMDSVLSSFDKRRLVLIMAKDTKPVVNYISEELHRGSTVLYGEGGFSGEARPTIMCLLTPRQTMVLKRYLAKSHPKSFMVITEASEVMGKGFKHWKNI
ncbi:MAG: YitT family protein [Synergistaceae bacterium]|nr:YitT family protein [Synergistaceae bacterium]MDD4705079.1 YitT family protein [Synergistaceae bacterium]